MLDCTRGRERTPWQGFTKTIIFLLAALIIIFASSGVSAQEKASEVASVSSQDGTLLYSGGTSISNLDPGQIWEFTISYPESPSEPAYPSLKILECALVKDFTETNLERSKDWPQSY